MLVKLLKFDIKRMRSTIIPMYLCLFILAVFDRVVHLLQKTDALSKIKAIEHIANSTQIFLMIGLLCLFFMVLVIGVNYYRENIMRDQGYLMHTLPVDAYQLVLSKLLSFLGYIICSAVVCYFILAVDFGNIRWYQKIYTDIMMVHMNPTKALCFCVNMGVYVIIYLSFCILLGYLAINIGYTVSGKLRPIAIVAVLMLFLMIGKGGELAVALFFIHAGYTNLDLAEVPLQAVQTLFISISCLYTVLSILCYVLAVRWLNRHLNLD